MQNYPLHNFRQTNTFQTGNRFDAVIHFADLSDEAKEKIARNFIQETIEKYKEDTIEMD